MPTIIVTLALVFFALIIMVILYRLAYNALESSLKFAGISGGLASMIALVVLLMYPNYLIVVILFCIALGVYRQTNQ